MELPDIWNKKKLSKNHFARGIKTTSRSNILLKPNLSREYKSYKVLALKKNAKSDSKRRSLLSCDYRVKKLKKRITNIGTQFISQNRSEAHKVSTLYNLIKKEFVLIEPSLKTQLEEIALFMAYHNEELNIEKHLGISDYDFNSSDELRVKKFAEFLEAVHKIYH